MEQLEVNNLGHVSINEDTSKPGDILDERYMLTEIVGRGGCGVVFRATDLHLQRDVAIKILSAEGLGSGEMLERFERESQILRQLHSQNTVHFYDCGQTPHGLPYIVMEFVSGRSLKDILDTEKIIAPKQAVGILIQVVHALEEAHAYGFVHRDLKPGNIMLCPRPGFPDDLVKVLDFGIAKVMKEDDGNMDMSKGEMAGTPKYMPPEQFKNESLTPSADLYSVGCIAYEMLTGIAPFEGETFHATVAKHLFMTPKSLPPEIEQYPNLVGVVFKLLEKVPGNRFASARKVVEALEYWMDPLLIPALDGCRLKGDDSQGDSFIEFYDDETSSTMPVSMPTNFAAVLANIVPEGPMPIPSSQHPSVSMPSMQAVPITHDGSGSRSLVTESTSNAMKIKIAVIATIIVVLLVAIIMASIMLGDEESKETVAEVDEPLETQTIDAEYDIILIDSAAKTLTASFMDALVFGLQPKDTLMHLDDLLYVAEHEMEEDKIAEKTAEKTQTKKKSRRSTKKDDEILTKFEFTLKYSPASARVGFLNAQGWCDEETSTCDVRTTSDTIPARIVVSAPGYITRSMLLKKKVTDIHIELKPEA